MQKRMILGAVISAFVLAGSLAASPVTSDYRSNGFVDRGVRLVQNADLPQISPSSLRRLTFYSDKALLALFDLVNEDLVAGEGGTISSDTTDAFRTAIERLIGAGGKADLEIDQTAIFFGQEVAVRFSGPIPILLQGANGEIDARDLFQGVAATKVAAGSQVADENYLAALQNESTSMQASATEAEVEVAEEVEENINPAAKVFFDRIVIFDGKRTITVEQGDSLADYANAFYGDPLLYRSIYLANRDILSNPNLLELGQVVTIPDT